MITKSRTVTLSSSVTLLSLSSTTSSNSTKRPPFPMNFSSKKDGPRNTKPKAFYGAKILETKDKPKLLCPLSVIMSTPCKPLI